MTSPDAASLFSRAREWAAKDPDAATAAELTNLLQLAAEGSPAASQDLADSFSGTLQFGTAGLRAALGAGPNRMNRVVVRRAAAGLADFLVDAPMRPASRPATCEVS
jgi:phosphomannomutase